MDKKIPRHLDYFRNILTPLSSKKLNKRHFVGFDCETYGDMNTFYMGGLYYYQGDKHIYKAFYAREEMIEFILSSRFRGKYIVATNLAFDLTVLFWGTKYWNNLNILERHSKIIYASYQKYSKEEIGKRYNRIHFIDTANYLFTSVENLGKIIGTRKKDKPSWLGNKPQNQHQVWELEVYNKYDCKISCDFMYFLQKGINEAGGNLKITIASTAFDIWRRNFLKQELVKEAFVLKNPEIKDFIFKGYYGGRTEAYKRGEFKDVYYYDINSLYPSVMCESFPLPQSCQIPEKVSIDNIHFYKGVSEVTVKVPYMNKPPLPYRCEKTKKLIFPIGRFRATYNHNEIAHAIKLGVKVEEIHQQLIYTEEFKPFKDFVDTFYKRRLEHKKQGSQLEVIDKLILTSLYGKFGQKKIVKSKIIDLEHDDRDYFEFVNDLPEHFDIIGNKLITREEVEFTGKNVYPILASYVTSYARILMYPYINQDCVIYTDTDSIICTEDLNLGNKVLGEMKLEGIFSKAYIVKPKFYYLTDNSGNNTVKIKGINKANIEDFNDLLKGQPVTKMKFTKLKESIRRNLTVNQKIDLVKQLDLIDTKREWIDHEEIEISKPLSI